MLAPGGTARGPKGAPMTHHPMKLVILDRDGTINAERDDYVKSVEEWEPLPGAVEGIARLNHDGWHVVVATNQSGLGRGLFDMATLNAIHDKMHKALAQVGGRIDALFFCPHAADSKCDCRKPKPGMFEEISRRFNMDLKGVPAIGDSLRDLQAATAMGAIPVLVRTGKGEKTLEAGGLPEGTLVFADLAEAVRHLTTPPA